MRAALIEAFTPMTSSIALAELPGEDVAEVLLEGAKKLNEYDGRYPELRSWTQTMTRVRALEWLLPAVGIWDKYLVLPCGAQWSAVFANAETGVDNSCAFQLTNAAHVRSLRVTVWPRGESAAELQRNFREGYFDGLGFEVNEWQPESGGAVERRNVKLVYDPSPEFFSLGEPLPGEVTSTYVAPKMRHKLTLSGVAALCELFGVPLLDDDWNALGGPVTVHQVDFGPSAIERFQSQLARIQPAGRVL